MSQKNHSLDASVLRINDGAPIKVTFMEARSGGHFVGFCTLDAGVFHDVRALFANVGPDTLIPNVSSVFLGNRLNGKTLVFFAVENGWTLNKDALWFNDAAAGHNGFFRLLNPPEEDGLFPVLEQGEIVWQKENGETVETAKDADCGTHRPVLVWQSDSGRISVFNGRISFSFGYGLYPELNQDDGHRFILTPQAENGSVLLSLTDAARQTVMAFGLRIGERNYAALTRNRVICAVLPLPEIGEPLTSVGIEIPDDYEDVLYLDGYEDCRTLPVAGTTFVIEAAGNVLTIKGDAPLSIYEALLTRVKIRTDASAAAKSPVRVVFKTAKGETVKTGETDILTETGATSVGGLSKTVMPASLVSTTERASFMAAAKPVEPLLPRGGDDDLPSFLTQNVPTTAPVPAVAAQPQKAMPAADKTALITETSPRMGKEIAQALAARGYNVIIHCQSAMAEASRVVDDLRQTYHVKAAYLRADFNSYEETADLIDTVCKTYGPIDLLVCRAGTFSYDETAQGWEMNTAVNVRAPFMLMRAFAKSLPKGRDGTALTVFPAVNGDELSCASLCGASLRSLVELAATALKGKVRVNGISFNGKKDDESDNRVVDAVVFAAQTPLMSGRILELDTCSIGERKK